MKSKYEISCDVVIFGGGVAGLWTLNTLVKEGYNALLVEKTRLGNDQTIRSQGMIHGGAKYSFFGDRRLDSAREVQLMPERWRRHLAGEEYPDLSNVTVSSNNIYLWISKGRGISGLIDAALTTIGTRFLTTKPEFTRDVPNFLKSSALVVYSLGEPVIDTSSLLGELASPHTDRIIYGSYRDSVLDEGSLNIRTITIEDKVNNLLYEINTQAVVLTAGQGNAELAREMGIHEEIMQVRPLRQVIARGNLPQFYGHCINNGPYVTITTHYDKEGNVVWNIGGKIAEDGFKIPKEELIRRAKQTLSEVLQGVDFSDVAWSTYDAQRAEAKTDEGKRPGGVQIYKRGNVVIGWPTKLALAPVIADSIKEEIGAMEIRSTKYVKIKPSEIKIAYHPLENETKE